MSKSRLTSPTPNSYSTDITQVPSSFESTTSRNQSHERTPSIPILGGGELSYPSRPKHQAHSLSHRTPEMNHRPPRPVGPAKSSTDHEMAQRIRRESPPTVGAPADNPSPSSDSQGDMADTEMDDKQSMQPAAAAAAPPPKQKRTRTLTTPHQSAVLRALLAQSRFPTTAMREEVGRSIGLSARKVQIWFQNQRQKARRPRSQSETSRKRFPPYGPSPGGPENTAVNSFPIAPDQGLSSHMGPAPHSASYSGGSWYPNSSGYHSSESYSGSLESPIQQLLGPGMPGSELQTDLSHRRRPAVLSRPSTALDSSTSDFIHHPRHFMRSSSPTRLFPPPPPSRPTTTSRLHDHDFSRILPPLVFNPPPGRSSFSARGPHDMHPSAPRPAYFPPYFTKRSTSPEAPFSDHSPETSSMSLILPPPYTLQPHPQWNSYTFTSPLRCGASTSWTRHGSRSASGSATPPGHLSHDPSSPFFHPRIEMESRPIEDALPQRSGRYDPVRAAFIYTSLSEPPHPSSPEAGDRSHRNQTATKRSETIVPPPTPDFSSRLSRNSPRRPT